MSKELPEENTHSSESWYFHVQQFLREQVNGWMNDYFRLSKQHSPCFFKHLHCCITCQRTDQIDNLGQDGWQQELWSNFSCALLNGGAAYLPSSPVIKEKQRRREWELLQLSEYQTSHYYNGAIFSKILFYSLTRMRRIQKINSPSLAIKVIHDW